MTHTFAQKIFLLSAIVLIISGVLITQISADLSVFALIFILVLVNGVLIFTVRMQLRNLQSIIKIANKVNEGNFNVGIDTQIEKNASMFAKSLAVITHQLKQQDLHIHQKTYQTTLLKEIAQGITVSFDEDEAIEIIAGSLGKIVPYSMISYLMIKHTGDMFLKCSVEASINSAFAEETKRIMYRAYTTLTGLSFKESAIKKSICFSAFFDEESKDPVRSHFSIPIFVNNSLVGIITATSTKPNIYSEEMIGTLYAIAEQAGSTITNIKNLISEESHKTHSMLTSINEGLIMVTTEQTIVTINKKAKEIIGLAHHDHPTLLDVIQALYGKFDFRGATDRVIASRATEVFQDFSVDNKIYKITASPVKEKKETIIGVVFIFSDITKEKEIDRMKTEFISITSHQLRTPLSSMKWFLEMLINKDAGTLPEKAESIVQDVYKSNERIITLVNDLLDVSRIEADKMQNEPTPTNFIEFIKSMLPEAEQQFKKRGQIFEFRRPDTLPRIMMDPRLVWQVLQNILSNASKYTPEGGKISLELTLKDPDILITVRDNGYGIPEFQQHRIFEKFFRADNTAKSEGTGLGMYIAKQIIDAMEGKIWFESLEGKGTTFYISLPLAGSMKKQKVALQTNPENILPLI